MANNDDVLDLSDLDLDSFDFDVSDTSGAYQKDQRLKGNGPIRDFGRGFRNSFEDPGFKYRLLRRVLKNALPTGYAQTWTAAESLYDQGKNVYRRLTNESAGELAQLVRKGEGALPKLRNRVSDKLYTRLENQIGKTRERLEASARYNNTQRNRWAQNADADAQTLEGLSALLKGQEEIASYQAEQSEDHYQREVREERIRDQVKTHRFDHQSEQLHSINASLNRIGNYQDQINYRFQKKSLELQYRSFFALRDMREDFRTQSNFQRMAYEAIAHNTGLPDAFKFQHGEHIEKDVRKRVRDRFREKAAETLPQFLSNYGQTAQKNAYDYLQRFLQNMTTGSSLVGGMNGGSPANLIGRLFGVGVQDFFENNVANRVGRMARPFVEARDRHMTGGGSSALSYLLANAPAMLQRYGNSMNQQEGFVGRSLRSLVRNIAPSFMPDNSLHGGGFLNMEQGTGFNYLTQRSITEIIPGYLSRVLQEIRMIRTGSTEVEREVFDSVSGRFTGFKAAQSALLDRVMPTFQRQNVAENVNRAVDNFDREEQLSANAREALRERLLREASTNDYFRPEDYATGQGYDQSVDDDTLAELQSFFRSRFELDDTGKLRRTAQNRRERERLSRELLDLRDSLPEANSTIRRLYTAGQQEMLREMGLIGNQNGRDFINFAAIRAYYNQSGTGRPPFEPSPSPGPNAPSGPDVSPSPYTVFSEEELDQLGVPSRTTGMKNKLRQYRDAQLQRMGAAGAAIGGGINAAGQAFRDFTRRRRMEDIYVHGREGPAITAAQLVEGKYIDLTTNQQVFGIQDITGPVLDPETGNQVITAEEFAAGLYNYQGESLLRSGLQSLKGFYENLYFAPARNAWRGLQTGIRFVENAFRKVKDGFIPGESVPRILGQLVEKGRYLDEATNKIITRLEDIQGTVWFHRQDGEWEVAVTQDELRELVDYKGNRLLTHLATFGERLKSQVTAPWRFLKSVGGITKRVSGAYGKAFGFLNDKFFRKKVEEDEQREERRETWQEKLLSVLRNTHGLLQDRMPERFRKGSWQQQLEEERQRDAAEEEAEATERQKRRLGGSGLLGALGGGIAALYKKLRNRGQNQEEEEGDGSLIGDVTAGGYSGGGNNSTGGGSDTPSSNNANKRGFKNRAKRFIKGAASKSWRGLKWAAGGALALSGIASTGILSSVGTGIAAAGGGLLTALTSPITLGIGATALGVYAAYKGYKWLTRWSPNEWERLRMLQHGAGPDVDINVLRMIRALETHFEDAAVFTDDNIAFQESKLNLKEVFDIMGVSTNPSTPEETAVIERFMTWAANRFKPVLSAWLTAMHRLTDKTKLADLDPRELQLVRENFLGVISFGNGDASPYRVTAVPWGDGQSQVTFDAINAAIAALKSQDVTRSKGQFQRTDKLSRDDGSPKQLTPLGRRADVNRAVTQSNNFQTALDQSVLQTAVNMAQGDLGTSRQRYATQADQVVYTPGRSGVLGTLESIRLRAYGLKELSRGRVDALFQLERGLIDQLRQNGDARVEFAGDAHEVMRRFSTLFGINASNEVARMRFVHWLNHRFIPVLLSFAGAVRQFNASLPLAQADTRLSNTQKVAVGRAIIGTTTTYKEVTQPVWGVDLNPFGDGSAALDDFQARQDLTYLEQQAASEKYRSESDGRQKRDDAPMMFKDRRDDVPEPSQRKDPLSNTRQAIDRMMGRNTTTDAKGGRQPPTNTQNRGTPFKNGNGPMKLGNEYQHLGASKGGVWQSIPEPTSQDIEGSRATIQAAAEMAGVDPELLATLIGIESNFQFATGPSTSGAWGWGQFIPDTWRAMLKKYGAKYGLDMNARRSNPRASALMAAEYIRENTKTLEKNLGYTPTDTDLYLAHFMGPGEAGASGFLKANPNAIAAQLQPTYAKANHNIYYGDNDRPRTVGELYQFINQEKMTKHRYGGFDTNNRDAQQTLGTVPSIYDRNTVETPDQANIREPEPSTPLSPAPSVKQQVSTPPADSVNYQGGMSFSAPLSMDEASESSERQTQRETERQEQVAFAQQEKARATQRQQTEQAKVRERRDVQHYDLMEKQLDEQIQMKGYLKEIAGYLKTQRQEREAQPSNQTAGNDTTQSSLPREGRPGKSTAPISMAHKNS